MRPIGAEPKPFLPPAAVAANLVQLSCSAFQSRMQLPDFDWIFFDCFNTLIDDFDAAGAEAGLLAVPQMAVAQGFFSSPEEFLAAYEKVRLQTLRLSRETVLGDRLRQVLQSAPTARSSEEAAAAAEGLMTAWTIDYEKLLRPTPGVQEMLTHWSARRALAVVTNSFVPGLPQRSLERFGLSRYFRFVLDSASHGFKKPNPLLGMEALSQARLGPCDGSHVLAVGDRHDIDIAAALDLGMHVVHFNRHPGGADGRAVEGAPEIRGWSEFR